MIIPEIRSIHCSDLDQGVVPSDPTDVFYDISIAVGMPNEKGEDNFGFIFITPKALSKLSVEDRKRIDPFRVVEYFEWAEVEAYVQAKCELSAAYEWHGVCENLRRWSHWEYEGYRR